MKGSLLFVSGLSGAGKTTLIDYALRNVPALEYLKTVTTRPRRPSEATSNEYLFVSDEEYERYKIASQHWDHTEYNGCEYGADVEDVRRKLEKGTHIICAVAPDKQVIVDMAKLYGERPTTIWIDTPREIAQARISSDRTRKTRIEDEGVKDTFDSIFTPTGNLQLDCSDFAETLKALLRDRGSFSKRQA